MLRRLLQIQIRHIVLVSIVLLILEIFSSGLYYYIAVKNTEDAQAVESVKTINRVRLSLLYMAQSPSTNFSSYVDKVQGELQRTARIQLQLLPTMPARGYVVSSDQLTIPDDIVQHLQNSLIANKSVTVITYVQAQNKWVEFHATDVTDANWKRALLSLLTHLIIILVLWTSFLLYYHFTLPREVIEQIANRSGGGRKSDRIISNLKQQIQSYYDEKNLMLAALAHDIKTPLTEAMLRIELLEDHETVAAVKENLSTINTIITSSLEYAKAPDDIKKVEVEVISLLESIIEHYDGSYFKAKLNTPLTECEMHIELQLFKRMIINVLDNAKKYASHCELLVTKLADGGLKIVCDDNGPGVPENLLSKLGTPYFRVDKSRSSQTGGTGLGLAIVKKVAQIHQGNATFRNKPEGGFSVEIVIYDDSQS